MQKLPNIRARSGVPLTALETILYRSPVSAKVDAMPVPGTNEKCRHVRFAAAIGG